MAEWRNAVHAKDWAALEVLYAPEIVLFDVVPPLQFCGPAVREGFVEWFEWYSGPIHYESTGQQVTVHGEVALCFSVDRVHGDLLDGTSTDYWLRHTVYLRKVADDWRIAHQHASLPVRIPDGNLDRGEVVLAQP